QFLRLIADEDRLPKTIPGDPGARTKSDNDSSDEAILRALLAAFPDRVCKRRESKSPRGVMVGGRGVRLADESAFADGDLFVAVEFKESKEQSELLVSQASRVEREWLPQSQITKLIDVKYDPSRERV